MNEISNTNEPQISYSDCYVQPFFSFYNADNMAIMRTFKDKEFDLAIVDPPYGINAEQGTNRASRKQFKDKVYGWDNTPPNIEYFTELQRISKNQIIWGANHFIELIPNATSKSWLVWDKKNPDRCFADAELAWCSNIDNVRIINIKRVQELNKKDNGKIHPTQKPVDLYDWILTKYANENFKIIDTHLGSGSIAIAIDKANTLDKKNLTFVGIELDPDYFRAAVERFKNHKRQCVLF